MRILYIHEHFITPQSGGGTRSYEFAQRLIAHGHQVLMLCGGDNNVLKLPSTKKKNVYRGDVDGIDVIKISLPYSNKDGLIKRTITFLKFALKSIYYVRKLDYDLIFATSTPLTAGIPAIYGRWFKRKDYIFEVRDLWPEIPKALGLKNKMALLGMSILEKWSYKYAKACVGLAPGIKEGIAKRSQKGKKIAIIPNGCDLNAFLPGNRAELELEGIGKNDTVAVFTGAHGPANGLDALINAAVVLKEKKRDDIKICFIGDGKCKADLETRAKNENLANCLFFPPMPKKQLCTLLGKVDIGLQILANVPAFYYGTSPNKFFDYITAGLPVVNNYPGWLADLINENKCGVAVEPDNPDALAEALIYLADHPEEKLTYGKNARALAEREFDRDLLGEQFVKFIEHV